MSQLSGLSMLLVACALSACTAPTPTLVAEERPAALRPVPTSGVRGRVQVVDGQLLSDIGTPLRGLTLSVDFDPELADFDLITKIAQTTGLNTLHVYLENSATTTGAMQAQADALVSLTARAGLYLILGIGGGRRNGEFVAAKVTAFWTRYAPRYAGQTHVFYEIQNNPEATCDMPVGAATLKMETDAYALIRKAAPDTHIVMFSASSVPRLSVAERAVEAVSSVVDFRNASYAMHTDDTEKPCTPVDELGATFDALRAKQIPVLISALPQIAPWAPVVSVAEAHGVGWIHHRFLADMDSKSTLAALISETNKSGLTWCPDQGTFPGMASGCP